MATDNIHARKDEKEIINTQDPMELRYWSNKFKVTKEQILEAVQAYGDDADAVGAYLKERHLIP